MSLQILCTDHNLSKSILKILTHYYNSPDKQNAGEVLSEQCSKDKQCINKKQQEQKQILQGTQPQIYIQTKYYCCRLPIKIDNNSLSQIAKDTQQLQNRAKVNMIMFVFDEHQLVPNIRQNIDRIINATRPQGMIILVNSKDNTNAHDQEQKQWKYQSQICQCQNFISVIYENLHRVSQLLPQRKNAGLLLQKQTEGQIQWQIFQLFQMLETTSWSNSEKKVKKEQKQAKMKRQEIQKSADTKPNLIQQKNCQIQKKNPQQNNIKDLQGTKTSQNQKQDGNFGDQQQQQLNQQQLQKQMVEFQSLMQEMMSIRQLPALGNQRKKKAQDILLKLANSIHDC